ncbi:MAG: hypothetical protein ACYTAF_04710 [Planctomycetota bacterium]|jgi:hypothetical protein
MHGISCDRCGKGLLIDEEVRYEVRIEVKAAHDPMELTEEDLARDHEAEMARLLEKMKDLTEQEAQDQVYREFRFDLCPPCQKEYLRDPLPKKD